MDKLSVIVPCYNEEKSVMLFYIELCKVICRMNHTEFEILFVVLFVTTRIHPHSGQINTFIIGTAASLLSYCLFAQGKI